MGRAGCDGHGLRLDTENGCAGVSVLEIDAGASNDWPSDVLGIAILFVFNFYKTRAVNRSTNIERPVKVHERFAIDQRRKFIVCREIREALRSDVNIDWVLRRIGVARRIPSGVGAGVGRNQMAQIGCIDIDGCTVNDLVEWIPSPGEIEDEGSSDVDPGR